MDLSCPLAGSPAAGTPYNRRFGMGVSASRPGGFVLDDGGALPDLLARRLAAAPDVAAACEVAVGHLARDGVGLPPRCTPS